MPGKRATSSNCPRCGIDSTPSDTSLCLNCSLADRARTCGGCGKKLIPGSLESGGPRIKYAGFLWHPGCMMVFNTPTKAGSSAFVGAGTALLPAKSLALNPLGSTSFEMPSTSGNCYLSYRMLAAHSEASMLAYLRPREDEGERNRLDSTTAAHKSGGASSDNVFESSNLGAFAASSIEESVRDMVLRPSTEAATASQSAPFVSDSLEAVARRLQACGLFREHLQSSFWGTSSLTGARGSEIIDFLLHSRQCKSRAEAHNVGRALLCSGMLTLAVFISNRGGGGGVASQFPASTSAFSVPTGSIEMTTGQSLKQQQQSATNIATSPPPAFEDSETHYYAYSRLSALGRRRVEKQRKRALVDASYPLKGLDTSSGMGSSTASSFEASASISSLKAPPPFFQESPSYPSSLLNARGASFMPGTPVTSELPPTFAARGGGGGGGDSVRDRDLTILSTSVGNRRGLTASLWGGGASLALGHEANPPPSRAPRGSISSSSTAAIALSSSSSPVLQSRRNSVGAYLGGQIPPLSLDGGSAVTTTPYPPQQQLLLLQQQQQQQQDKDSSLSLDAAPAAAHDVTLVASSTPSAMPLPLDPITEARHGLIALRMQLNSRFVTEGWLIKQGHKFKTWRKRWFVLSGFELKYYRSGPHASKGLSGIEVAGNIDIRSYSLEMATIARSSLCMRLASKHAMDDEYLVHAEKEADFVSWVKAISLTMADYAALEDKDADLLAKMEPTRGGATYSFIGSR